MSPRKMSPRKIGRRKNGTGKLRNKKSWVEPRASWYVCRMLGYGQSMKTENSMANPKLGNKKSWGER